MNLDRLVRCAGLGALVVLIGAAPPKATPAPLSIPHFPKATATDLGSAKLIAESDDDSRVSGIQIFFKAGLERQTAASSGVAALTAECIVRTPVDGVPVRDAIASRGGTLQYTVDGRSTHYYIEGRSERLPALVMTFARALASPDVSPATLGPARAALSARVNETRGAALAVGIDMFRRSYYDGAAGLPTLGTTASLASLVSGDVAAFYKGNYKRGGVSASAVGLLGPALSDAMRTLLGGLPEGTPSAIAQKSRTIPENSPRIVARRDVVAPLVIVGFAAPPPASKDFGAMLILESLLSNAFERSSATTLGFGERAVGAFYLYDGTPASLVIYVNGNRVDPSIAIRELFVVSRTLSLKPLSPDALLRFKTAAMGTFVTETVSLADRSYVLGTFAAQGLGSDSINAALSSLDRATPADVQRVATRYLQRYIVALVLPRSSPVGN
jgi:predicted Zn-dependent peptidase